MISNIFRNYRDLTDESDNVMLTFGPVPSRRLGRSLGSNIFLNDETEFTRRIDKKKREIFESVSTLHTLKPDHPSSKTYPTLYPPLNLKE